MGSLVARKGRNKQRYEDQLRLVAGCIPYKIEKDVENQNTNFESRLSVLMISTPNRDDLVFPKGGWEDDETVYEAACREALEEAGVKGILSEKPLGVWEFRSKSRQDSCSLEGGCRGYMFTLEVTEELDSWPEQESYKRKWLTTEEAFKFCRYDWMKEALRNFLTLLSTNEMNASVEKLSELPMITAADTLAEHQRLSAGCSGKPSTMHHLEESCTTSIMLRLVLPQPFS
ncbi:hypothetical protein SLEP1_g9552 [Rubroshorea leprosula]|uniref:Nudix hydrolase domain-containing protein n=2 Tax=Rubroshorea leprosula TaxID=152421 RepID=A0AAV5IEM0_9ROSI|nr:hypothetical protein SLEP1_g9552 [Rubroshorea leprosula]